jgi:hypothetical protein
MKLPTAEFLSADEAHSIRQDRLADYKSFGLAFFIGVKQATLTALMRANDTIRFLILKIPSRTSCSLPYNV